MVMLVSLLGAKPVLAAEVYYLGGGGAGTAGQMNPAFPFQQRVKDLFDFGAYGQDNPERSGRIAGTLTQEVRWNKVTGNKSKSFLRDGTDYVTEANISLQEKLWQDYNFEGQVFIRKTDDPRTEVRRDVRLKQFNMKVLNPRNLYEFGDFYADFSPFTLSSSLEGLNMEVSPRDLYTVKMVAARNQSADVVAETFQRHVAGTKVDWNLFQESEIFSGFRIGAQAVTNQDDSSSLDRTSSMKDLRNTVAGIDGEMSLTKYLSLNYEVARSAYIEDEDAPSGKDQQYGTAFRAQPSLNLGKTTARYLYYYVQPKFYTDIGSAASDKIQHQINVDQQLSAKATLSLMQNWYWDHLKNSSRTKRTIYDEKNVSLNWRPFDSRQDFSVRPYASYQQKDSDDSENTAEGVTRTIGFSVNDRLDEKTTGGVNYEYRSYRDDAYQTSSDYFNRIGLNLSREGQLFQRRIYQSIGPNMDFRRTKRDPNTDVSFSTSYSGQYDISSIWTSRWGHNVQVANNAGPAQDFFNNRSYLEMDFLIDQRRASRFVVRAERNRYDHEDFDQDYKETRVTGRFSISF